MRASKEILHPQGQITLFSAQYWWYLRATQCPCSKTLINQQMRVTVAGNGGCMRKVRGMGGDGGEEGEWWRNTQWWQQYNEDDALPTLKDNNQLPKNNNQPTMVTPGHNGQWRVKLGRWGERAKMAEGRTSATRSQQRGWKHCCPCSAHHFKSNNYLTMVAASGSRRTQQAMEGKVRERVDKGKMVVGRGAQQNQCHQQSWWE